MNRLRVLVVDDEPLALDRLTALFHQLPEVDVVGTARDGLEAVRRIDELRPDLVMLDIQMPERSGLLIAADLPPDDRPEIVFVTAFEQFAPDAFGVDAADYLLKPVRFDRLRQAVERAKRRRALFRTAATPELESAKSEFEDAIWVQVKGGSVRVSVGSIDWIEAAGDYVMLHTATRSHIHRATMSVLARRLDPTQLMRVHRSAFVRPGAVEEVRRQPHEGLLLVLRDGVAVPVGPSYLDAVRKTFAKEVGQPMGQRTM
jgi:DNA-binding LytR/AlgR family response regulator